MNRTVIATTILFGRHRIGRLAFAFSSLALLGLSASALPAAASPAAPRAGIKSFFFTTGVAHLRGGGHVWSLNLGLVGVGAFDTVAFSISTPHLGGIEHHTWGGQLEADEVSVSSAAKVTIDSRSNLSPVASLSLTFKPTSHKTTAADCATGKEIIYTGTFKGSVRLNTGLKGLKLNAAPVSFGTHNTLTVLGSCVFSPCHFINWDSTSGPPGSAALAGGLDIVIPGHFSDTTIIRRSVAIPGKNGLVRDDEWSIAAKAPTFNKASKSLSVTSSSSGLVTGSATFAHGKPSGPPPFTPKICLFQGKKYVQHDTQYLNASFKASRPFEAHSILNGLVKVQRSSVGRFDIVTLKRK